MIKLKWLLSVALLGGSLAGCWKSEDNVGPEPEHFKGKQGVVTFDSYAPLSAKPVKVYYNIPTGKSRISMPILIVMAGVERNAADYRNAWVTDSDAKGFMVFAPEFTTTYYPGSSNYNQGGIFNGSIVRPEAEWTFSLIEALFDFIRDDLGSNRENYDLWGHSAGGQFVHRYVLFKPDARIDRAVAANPGWYTVPDLAVGWPYGLLSSPATSATLTKAFAQHLVVQLGTSDTNANDPNLDHNAAADLQGLTRYARGQYFWNVANGTKAGYPAFNWEKREVAGVAHEYRKMATDAAKLLYR